MRRILVDSARARRSAKRGGGLRVALDPEEIASPERDPELLYLDDAISALSQIDPRKSRVIEMRVFGGLNVEEVAEVLQISPPSVQRDWRLGKAWLMREMSRNMQ
jgi:RNA polymerase sigma factor (TIGR02999 family)